MVMIDFFVNICFCWHPVFGFGSVQFTKDFQMCWSGATDCQQKMFMLRYSALVRTLKQRIVHGHGPSKKLNNYDKLQH